MIILFHRTFKKRYQRLRQNEKEKFKERRNLFLKNPFDPILNNHALKGRYYGYRSINIGGDLRAIFKRIDDTTVFFITLGTHPKLYS